MNADGTNVVRLTNTPQYEDNPSWSPDGTMIAFDRQMAVGSYQIFVVDATGENETQITFAPLNAGDPTWSPDGSQIAFTNFVAGDLEIYVMWTERIRWISRIAPARKSSPTGAGLPDSEALRGVALRQLDVSFREVVAFGQERLRGDSSSRIGDAIAEVE